jgi:hypothetical protein
MKCFSPMRTKPPYSSRCNRDTKPKFCGGRSATHPQSADTVRCASFDLLVRASEREQLFALGMLCTGTKRGRFFWGLDWTACPCIHKFCVAIADVRKRTFHCAPCDPRAECMRVGVGGNRVFALDIVFLAAASGAKQPDGCWYENSSRHTRRRSHA